MKPIVISLLVIVYATSLAHGTCVLESDFGFILNCNFKKSGLFRVRNLGGLKAHFGLGFSLGDELGFGESLGNLEGNRRRALNYRTGFNNIGVLPASKLPPLPNPPIIQQNRPIALPPRPKIGMPNRLATKSPQYKRTSSPFMTHAASLPLGVPAFRPIPKEDRLNVASSNTFSKKVMPGMFSVQNYTFLQTGLNNAISNNYLNNPIPEFQAMPPSVSRISTNDATHKEDPIYNQPDDLPAFDLRGHTIEELAAAANVSVQAIRQAIIMRQQQILAQRQAEIVKQKLLTEQQANLIKEQLLKAAATTTTTTQRTTTTTTTTVLPTKAPTMRSSIAGGNKVMNAPREYYPAGYEKNFDDNFTTKVDLPPTSFHCGDQKHFPGLYADTDLGCMVFHVCALTDDGLIMKSFLCPESTLFDQTILKCNWWFYVDCKSSKSLYDSNIPVSKSYQLMKSLKYFSNYKNSNNDKDPVDIEALKNTVSGSSNDST